ncbi:MAG: PLP-dependent aminotransferase family protein [Bryobacterales bacterium]|nr:PLP-dependent aminotransferase family protein [Bryobacterales bacterium]MBV9400357.1 PLP-dependent aminotransferase family protein [Bryobacterales bacterium]
MAGWEAEIEPRRGSTKKKPHGIAVPMIAVDRESDKPLHRQIYDAFRAMILESRLQPGQQIPSSRALALDLRISRIPVLGAYAQLLAEGYIESRTGAGTFVTETLSQEVLSSRPAPASLSADPALDAISRVSRLLPLEGTPWFRGSGAFSVGQIAYDHFPFRVWSDLVTHHARRVSSGSMNYSDPMGSEEFREVIAVYLRTSRAVRCEASQIMVVNGSQHALDLSARVLLDPESSVWIEEPGYVFLRHVLTLSGCRLVPVPVDNEGLNVAAGLKLCPEARVTYVTPSHQYPLGATMSAARRLQLIEWARRFGGWIVEDDYDSEYRYESMPVASMQGLDPSSRVIYIGTFSKTLFPSLRIGYVVIPPALVDRFLAVRQANDLSPSHLYQAALADFIRQGHFARHVRRTRQLYAERRNALTNALGKEFGPELEILGAEAGMHLVITIPPGFSDKRISARAAQEDLWLWPLSSAYAGENVRQGFVLGFGGTKADEMPDRVRRLRMAVDRESGHLETAQSGH